MIHIEQWCNRCIQVSGTLEIKAVPKLDARGRCALVVASGPGAGGGRHACVARGGGAVATAVGVASFMLLVPGPAVLPWEPYSSSRLAQLTSEGKTVMVDFTAGWCANCKWNLKVAINRSQVAAAIEEGNVVPLLADFTDGSDEIEQELNRLGRNAIPVLAIYPARRPTEPIILDSLVTMGQVLEALEKAGPSNPSGTKLSSRGGE
jgi:thiol-disulfide isomerase/thioredoxin